MRQVGVLGEGLVADAADVAERAPGGRPRSRRARSACTGSTSYMRRSRLKPMTYSMCCQRPSRPRAVADLRVARDRADRRVGEGLDEPADRVRFEDGVAVDHDQDVVPGVRDAGVERGRLAGVGLRGSPSPARAPSASTMSAVPSVEPSSTTMISSSGSRWRPASARRARCRPPRCRPGRSTETGGA